MISSSSECRSSPSKNVFRMQPERFGFLLLSRIVCDEKRVVPVLGGRNMESSMWEYSTPTVVCALRVPVPFLCGA
jgi:hypothetical protein